MSSCVMGKEFDKQMTEHDRAPFNHGTFVLIKFGFNSVLCTQWSFTDCFTFRVLECFQAFAFEQTNNCAVGANRGAFGSRGFGD